MLSILFYFILFLFFCSFFSNFFFLIFVPFLFHCLQAMDEIQGLLILKSHSLDIAVLGSLAVGLGSFLRLNDGWVI